MRSSTFPTIAIICFLSLRSFDNPKDSSKLPRGDTGGRLWRKSTRTKTIQDIFQGRYIANHSKAHSHVTARHWNSPSLLAPDLQDLPQA